LPARGGSECDANTDVRRGSQAIEGVRVPRPKPGFEKPPLLSARSTRYGWWTRVTVRATDRIGAPTGTLAYAALIRAASVPG
jgi:hypothetical protein